MEFCSWEQTYLRLCQKSLILAKEKDSGYRETNVKLPFFFKCFYIVCVRAYMQVYTGGVEDYHPAPWGSLLMAWGLQMTGLSGHSAPRILLSHTSSRLRYQACSTFSFLHGEDQTQVLMFGKHFTNWANLLVPWNYFCLDLTQATHNTSWK